MRDAIGSTFMLRIFIIFLVLYIVFMCFTVSYAKTFRLKNGVIDMLEHSQYQGTDSDFENIAKGSIDTYLSNSAYNFPKDYHPQIESHCGNVGGELTSNGACIISKDDGDERYYQVYLYIVYYFSFFRWEVVMPIGGETDIIPEI